MSGTHFECHVLATPLPKQITVSFNDKLHYCICMSLWQRISQGQDFSSCTPKSIFKSGADGIGHIPLSEGIPLNNTHCGYQERRTSLKRLYFHLVSTCKAHLERVSSYQELRGEMCLELDTSYVSKARDCALGEIHLEQTGILTGREGGCGMRSFWESANTS